MVTESVASNSLDKLVSMKPGNNVIINSKVIHILGLSSGAIDQNLLEECIGKAGIKSTCNFLLSNDPRELTNTKYEDYDIILFDASMLNDDWWFYLSSMTSLPIIFLTDHQMDSRIIESTYFGTHEYMVIDQDNKYLSRLPHRILRSIHIYKELERQKVLIATLDNSSDAVVVIKQAEDIFTSPIVFTNKLFLSGVCQRDICQTPILRNCLDLSRNYDAENFLKAAFLENRFNNIKLKLSKRNGDDCWYTVNISHICDSFENVQYVAIHFNDITKSKHYEQDLINAKVVAEQAKVSEQQFLATMSHEIRTPITSIMGLSKLLSRTKMDYEQQEYLTSIESSTEILIALVNDILDLSKIEKGAIELSMLDFDLRTLCNSLARPFRQNAHAKGLNFNYFYDSGIEKVIEGDKIRINQILINLLGNALKYTDKGDVSFKVKLIAESDRTYTIRFAITDTGKGISPLELPHIFKKYKQLKRHSSSDIKGTGLGLYIVKNLINIHGSDIEVNSKLGVGSEFAFNLTVNKGDSGTNDTDDHVSASLNNVKILVVEDNDLNRSILIKQLESLSAIPIGSANGAESLPILSGLNNIDLVLIDLNMPVLNGIDTIKIIRNILDIKLPIIVLSANEEKNEMFQEIRPYVNDVISKPYKMEDLIEKMGKVIIDSRKISIPHQSFSIQTLTDISDDDEFTQSMIQKTYQQIMEASDNFSKAIDSGNLVTIQENAHKTKSTAGIFKAKTIYKLCDLVEMTARQKNAELTIALTRTLRIKCDRLLFELDNSYPELNLQNIGSI